MSQFNMMNSLDSQQDVIKTAYIIKSMETSTVTIPIVNLSEYSMLEIEVKDFIKNNPKCSTHEILDKFVNQNEILITEILNNLIFDPKIRVSDTRI